MATSNDAAAHGLFGPPSRVDPDTPSEAGAQLAEEMFDRTDVQRTILAETAASAARGQLTESGRTACRQGTRVFAPAARRARSIKLRSCYQGSTGIWHSHVSQNELRNPSHSLPDVANVIFGGVTASIVVGHETSEACVEPAEPGVAGAAFQDAVGVDVRSSREVVRALDRGEIANPPAARDRVRQALPGLFERRATPHPELRDALSISTIPIRAPTPEEDGGAGHPDAGTPGGPHVAAGEPAFGDPERVREQARDVADAWRDLLNVSAKDVAASYVVSSVVEILVDSVLFE